MIAVSIISLALAALAADDPEVGTWKLNITKSKFAGTPPKSWISKVIPLNGGYRIVNDQITADGTKHHNEYSILIDGKDHPVEGTPGKTLALSRIDAYTVKYISKTEGKGTGMGTVVFSKDGMIKTQFHSDGATVTVFEKQ